MYLRVTAFRSDPTTIDKGIDFLKAQIIPSLKKMPGFLGVTCIVDRQKGEAAASTLWESLEAMNNAEKIGSDSRLKSSEATGLEVVDVDRFEMTVLEMPAPNAPLPSYTRLTTAYHDPKNADSVTKQLREAVLPKLKSQPGFRAFAAGINRMTGRGFTTSSWDTPQYREASHTAVADQRQKTIDSGGLYGLEVANVETVVADVKLPVAR